MSLEKFLGIKKKELTTHEQEIEDFKNFNIPKTCVKGKREGERFIVSFIFNNLQDAETIAKFFQKTEQELDGQKLLKLIGKQKLDRWVK